LLTGVAAVVPETYAVRTTPILPNRKRPAEVVGALAVFLDGLQDVFVGALSRQGQGIAGSDFKTGQGRLIVNVPKIGEGLKVVEQRCIVGLVVQDGKAGNGRNSKLGAARGIG